MLTPLTLRKRGQEDNSPQEGGKESNPPNPPYQGESLIKQISPLPPRKIVNSESEWSALDAIIFGALNLTQGERDGVYAAVVNLVESRLRKARSLKGK